VPNWASGPWSGALLKENGSVLVGLLFALVAVFLNIHATRFLITIQESLSKGGKIPARNVIPGNNRKSLFYLQDLWFFRWGDKWFLSAMDGAIAFVLVVRKDPVSWWQILLCMATVALWTGFWHFEWLNSKKHKPDPFYPERGKITLFGYCHLVYFWCQYAFGAIGLTVVIKMAMGNVAWSPVVAIGLIAAIGYFATLAADIRTGRASN